MTFLKRNFFKALFLLLSLLPFFTFAQDDNTVEMADSFRDEGKIFVVIAIISLILLGLIIYLSLIDRRVKRLERRMKREK